MEKLPTYTAVSSSCSWFLTSTTFYAIPPRCRRVVGRRHRRLHPGRFHAHASRISRLHHSARGRAPPLGEPALSPCHRLRGRRVAGDRGQADRGRSCRARRCHRATRDVGVRVRHRPNEGRVAIVSLSTDLHRRWFSGWMAGQLQLVFRRPNDSQVLALFGHAEKADRVPMHEVVTGMVNGVKQYY